MPVEKLPAPRHKTPDGQAAKLVTKRFINKVFFLGWGCGALFGMGTGTIIG